MLQPVVRRTWAPRGQTPVHHSWDRHDRLSAISALTVSPKRRRLGLHFDIHDHNIRTDEVEAFVRWLRRHFPKGLILVMDRLAAHRSAAKRLVARFGRNLDVEWLALPPSRLHLDLCGEGADVGADSGLGGSCVTGDDEAVHSFQLDGQQTADGVVGDSVLT